MREFAFLSRCFPGSAKPYRGRRPLVAHAPGRPHDCTMVGGWRFRPSSIFGYALAALVSVAAVANADPASGPAYGVEPGEAPKNSVSVDAAAGSAPSGKAPVPVSAAPNAPQAPAAAPPPSNPGASTPAPPESAPADGAAPAGTTGSTDVSDRDPRALSDFRPQLDPYGQWVEDPKYGTVWVPDRTVVGESFSPYVTAGHWALDTDGNWVWVSDYPFGEVVFHYGRWVWTGGYGWSWVPGYEYAPAWVVWRVPTADYAYVGWAPMPPVFGWWGGIGVGLWWGPPYYWAFCPSRFVFSHYTSYYVVHDRTFVRTLAGSTQRYISSPRVTSSGRVTPSGPSMQSARVPSSSMPTARIPAGSGRMFSSAGAHSTYANYSSRPAIQSSPSRVVPYNGQRGFPSTRTYSATPRSTYGAYSPAPRTFSATPRPYSAAPRAFSPAYSASPRAYSPSYSAPAHVYSPSPRVYSTSHYSTPSYHYSAPVYHSAPSYHPSFSAPHYSGGGGHFGGGGGHHR